MSIASPPVATRRVLVAWGPADRRPEVLERLESSLGEVTEVEDGFELLRRLTTTCSWYPSPAPPYDLVLASTQLQGYSAMEVMDELGLRGTRFLLLVPERAAAPPRRAGVLTVDDPTIAASCVEWLLRNPALPSRPR